MSNSMRLPPIDAAKTFIDAKGRRLPVTIEEFYEWLREFGQFERDRADQCQKLLEEHMYICTAQRVVPKVAEQDFALALDRELGQPSSQIALMGERTKRLREALEGLYNQHRCPFVVDHHVCAVCQSACRALESE